MNQVISNSVKRRVSLSVRHQKHYIHLQFKGQNWQDPVHSLLPFGVSGNEWHITPFRVRSKGRSSHLTCITTSLGKYLNLGNDRRKTNTEFIAELLIFRKGVLGT